MAEKIFPRTERRKRSEQRECQICGSPAFYAYFGLISCEACKVFFKRYADLGEVCSVFFQSISHQIFFLESFQMCIQ